MVNVFISYRREGGSEIARLVYEQLDRYPNISPVLDVERLESGSFDTQIYNQIENCDAFILVLQKDALDRCIYANDWVRMEIEHAMKCNKTIIPVMEEGFVFPNELPKTLIPLKTQNGVVYSHTYFNQMIETLASRIQNTTTEDINLDPEAPKKKKKKTFMIVGGILAVVIIVIAAVFATKKVDNETVTEVYFSKIMPYTQAAYYTSTGSDSDNGSTSLETDKAFDILSFIKNGEESDAIVEDVYCKIESLETDYAPVLSIGAVIDQNASNQIKAFVGNDSWGEAQNIKVNCELTDGNQKKYDFSEIMTQTDGIDTLESGEIGLGAIYTIDKNKFDALLSSQNFKPLQVTTDSKKNANAIQIRLSSSADGCKKGTNFSASLYFDADKQRFEFFRGGYGDGKEDIKCFALLDVDSAPSEIHFLGDNSFEKVEGTTKVDTVIVPTKSCTVQCKNIFIINGKKQQTKLFTAIIRVPFYQHGFLRDEKLLNKLNSIDPSDTYNLSQEASSYRYDPLSILPEGNLKKELQESRKLEN